MATAFDTTQNNVLPTNGYAYHRPQTRLFGQLNFGPRFNEGLVTVTRPDLHAADTKKFSLYYRVYNPSSIHSKESPPLVVLHGGPSLPSNYLYPLAQQFSTSRSIIFYDQLGCGQSSQPEDRCMYSIENAVHDLQELVHSLQLEKFHLLGHSFGGIVAYEYLAAGLHAGSSDCLSLTLDSTPSNMKTSLEECSRLGEEVKNDLILGDMNVAEATRLVQDQLRRHFECRLDRMPDSLVTAIEMRGTVFGPEEVVDYVAHPPSRDSLMPPVLMIRGQYDFITEKCIEGWREIFSQDSKSRGIAYREEEMNGCAHYCHLEDAQSFGDLIKSHCFINDY